MRLALLLTGYAALTLGACAIGRSSVEAPTRVADITTTVVADGAVRAPVAVVRAFPRSATVQVVAFDPNDVGFGLRTALRRADGVVVGDERFGNQGLGIHHLYLATEFVEEMGGFSRAVLFPERVVLSATATVRDPEACRAGACTPREIRGFRIPDSLLRRHPDSLVVTFQRDPSEWTLTLSQDLLRTYLRTVDSAAATLRGVASAR